MILIKILFSSSLLVYSKNDINKDIIFFFIISSTILIIYTVNKDINQVVEYYQ